MNDALPHVAAVTMVRDEGPMLRRWIDYYGGQLGLDHLVVVDDNSVDGSTEDLPCTVVRIPPIGKHPFEPTRMGLLSKLAAALLMVHDAVIFADADEFIVPDPSTYDGLRDYLARNDADVLGVAALNVVQLAGEPPLDLAHPFADQRRYAKFLPLMCKPAIKRVDAAWRWASHGIMAPYAIDPQLFMFHMKYADRDLLHAAAERRRAMVELDGRAAETSWSKGPDEQTALLDRIRDEADPASIPTFKPGPKKFEDVVQERPDGSWRAVGAGQMQAMERRPLVEIPKRFRTGTTW